MKTIIKENKRNKVITDWLDKYHRNLNVDYRRVWSVDYAMLYHTDDYYGYGATVILHTVETNTTTLINNQFNSEMFGFFGPLLNSDLLYIFKPWLEENYNISPDIVKIGF